MVDPSNMVNKYAEYQNKINSPNYTPQGDLATGKKITSAYNQSKGFYDRAMKELQKRMGQAQQQMGSGSIEEQIAASKQYRNTSDLYETLTSAKGGLQRQRISSLSDLGQQAIRGQYGLREQDLSGQYDLAQTGLQTEGRIKQTGLRQSGKTERTGIRQEGKTERLGRRQKGKTEREKARLNLKRNIQDRKWDLKEDKWDTHKERTRTTLNSRGVF